MSAVPSPDVDMIGLDRSSSREAREARIFAVGEEDGTPSIARAERGHDVLHALQEAVSEAQEDGWDGYSARSMDLGAFVYAIEFLKLLPSVIPLPEISVDSDGDVALEWDRGSRRVFSVRVSRDGTIYYAGLVNYSTFHGSEQLGESIPEAISSGIRRVLSESPL
jgi:hypothetical protein